jgi:hypothetical protein
LYLVSHSIAVLSRFTLTVHHWLINEQEGITRMESPVTGCARKKINSATQPALSLLYYIPFHAISCRSLQNCEQSGISDARCQSHKRSVSKVLKISKSRIF